MFRYQGHVGAYLVLGGVDTTGAQLFTVAAHGSTDKLPYVTLGSGSLAAMAVFESSFKQNMKVSYRIGFGETKLTLGSYSGKKPSTWLLGLFALVSSTISDQVAMSMWR